MSRKKKRKVLASNQIFENLTNKYSESEPRHRFGAVSEVKPQTGRDSKRYPP